MVKKMAIALAGAAMLTVTAASPTFAHYCSNANKKEGAGSVGTFDIVTGEATITREHGGFITITDGTNSYEVFYNPLLPENARNAGPGDDVCDGKGVDDAMACSVGGA